MTRILVKTDHENIDLCGLKKALKFLGRQKQRKTSACLPYLLDSREVNVCLLIFHTC
jgi:hypothetical protein